MDNDLKVTKGEKVLAKEHEEPLHYELAEMLYRSEGIVTFKEIAVMIRELRRKRNLPPKQITIADVHSGVSLCRERLEVAYNCTLVNAREVGYRICRAFSKDIAIFAAKSVRRTVMYADRANRLTPLINAEHLPKAIDNVFSKASRRIQRLSGVKRHLLSQWKKAKKELEVATNGHTKN
jgi:hypothetical protein